MNGAHRSVALVIIAVATVAMSSGPKANRCGKRTSVSYPSIVRELNRVANCAKPFCPGGYRNSSTFVSTLGLWQGNPQTAQFSVAVQNAIMYQASLVAKQNVPNCPSGGKKVVTGYEFFIHPLGNTVHQIRVKVYYACCSDEKPS